MYSSFFNHSHMLYIQFLFVVLRVSLCIKICSQHQKIMYVGRWHRDQNENDRFRLFSGKGRVLFEEMVFVDERKTSSLFTLSSLRASRSDAVGLLEGSGCIICFMMRYKVGLISKGLDSLPSRRSCQSWPQCGRGQPTQVSYKVIPNEKISHLVRSSGVPSNKSLGM